MKRKGMCYMKGGVNKGVVLHEGVVKTGVVIHGGLVKRKGPLGHPLGL